MRALLDVSLLIALLDPDHVQHHRAMSWLDAHITHGWASCPLTQNGCIRIMGQSSYPSSRPLGDVARRLRDATAAEHHEFWADDISVLDQRVFDWQHLLYSRQLTDTYLLALAVRNNGVLVTLDEHINPKAVHGATGKHLVIL